MADLRFAPGDTIVFRPCNTTWNVTDMIRSIEINDDNGPAGIYELKIYSIRFQRVHNFFTKVGADYKELYLEQKTIEAAVLGELSAETLARIKTEDDRP